MDEDGGNKQWLVLGDAPDWGPNGQIVYTISPMPGQPSEIWVVDAEGGTPRQVTSGGSHGGRVHPSWSPDGKRLVYMQLAPQDPGTDDTANGCPALSFRAELWIINADGTNARLLTTTGFSNVDPSGQRINSAPDANAHDWSAAGDHIVFWSGQEQCYGQVWRINVDGSGRTQLTKAPIPFEGQKHSCPSLFDPVGPYRLDLGCVPLWISRCAVRSEYTFEELCSNCCRRVDVEAIGFGIDGQRRGSDWVGECRELDRSCPRGDLVRPV